MSQWDDDGIFRLSFKKVGQKICIALNISYFCQPESGVLVTFVWYLDASGLLLEFSRNTKLAIGFQFNALPVQCSYVVIVNRFQLNHTKRQNGE